LQCFCRITDLIGHFHSFVSSLLKRLLFSYVEFDKRPASRNFLGMRLLCLFLPPKWLQNVYVPHFMDRRATCHDGRAAFFGPDLLLSSPHPYFRDLQDTWLFSPPLFLRSPATPLYPWWSCVHLLAFSLKFIDERLNHIHLDRVPLFFLIASVNMIQDSITHLSLNPRLLLFSWRSRCA